MEPIDRLNPDYVVMPDRLPWKARLAFWLDNPLLASTPARLEATREEARFYTTDTEREALVHRLKKVVAERRESMTGRCDDGMSRGEMLKTMSHELLNNIEKSELHKFYRSLSAHEWRWFWDFLDVVLKRRTDAAYAHAA